MQAELEATYPRLDIQFVGVNWAGLESANARFTQGNHLPWLQDMDHDGDRMSDAWAEWGAGHLDLVVLDGENQVAGVMNLIAQSLDVPENYAALRDAVIDVAMMSQKPWHHAEAPLDVDQSGFVSPLDALMIINRLNSLGSGRLPPPVGNQPPPPYYDTNGDGNSTPLDVLMVINYLNAPSARAAGEGGSWAQEQLPPAQDGGADAPRRVEFPAAALPADGLSAQEVFPAAISGGGASPSGRSVTPSYLETPSAAISSVSQARTQLRDSASGLGEVTGRPMGPAESDHALAATDMVWRDFGSAAMHSQIEADLPLRLEMMLDQAAMAFT